jgi:hypothetical protein
MRSKPHEERSDGKKLRDRALRCHCLAVGAGDPTFAAKLNALADEYEARALQADQKVCWDKKESTLS